MRAHTGPGSLLFACALRTIFVGGSSYERPILLSVENASDCNQQFPYPFYGIKTQKS